MSFTRLAPALVLARTNAIANDFIGDSQISARSNCKRRKILRQRNTDNVAREERVEPPSDGGHASFEPPRVNNSSLALGRKARGACLGRPLLACLARLSADVAQSSTTLTSLQRREIVLALITQIKVDEEQILMRLDRASIPSVALPDWSLGSMKPASPFEPLVLSITASLQRAGKGIRLVIGGGAANAINRGSPRSSPEQSPRARCSSRAKMTALRRWPRGWVCGGITWLCCCAYRISRPKLSGPSSPASARSS
jgi:hypothetical protein